jgi:hypothetical protein
MKNVMKRGTLFLTSAFLFLFTGCSSFHREWKAASAQHGADGLAGAWQGEWVSDRNGHHGRLRCVMTPQGTNTYKAHFHAIFWKVFRATYQVPFAATSSNNIVFFSGESNLGLLAGGTYTYEGSATGSAFHSTYRSKYDHGRFEMTRPLSK